MTAPAIAVSHPLAVMRVSPLAAGKRFVPQLFGSLLGAMWIDPTIAFVITAAAVLLVWKMMVVCSKTRKR